MSNSLQSHGLQHTRTPWSLPKFMFIASVMPSNHFVLCHPLLLLPSIFPSIRVSSNELTAYIKYPKTDMLIYNSHTIKFTHLMCGSEVTQSCPTLCDSMDCSPPGFSIWGFPGKNTGVGCHFLLQGIFPTQGLSPGLLH